MIGRFFISLAAALFAGAALFVSAPLARAEMSLPVGAQALALRETPLGTYALPTGPVGADGVPSRAIEGRILRRTYRIRGEATVLQVLAPLREQLLETGYELLFQCEARQCGGFDFRFGIEVVPAPDMAVSIGDYHFLSAVKGASAVTLLASRSGTSAYLQIIEVSPPEAAALELAPSIPAGQAETDEAAGAGAESLPDGNPTDLAQALLEQGRAILPGLDFGTGDVALGRENYESLKALAEFLAEFPDYSVVVVGHTDTVGSLQDNTDLSRRRAEAVKTHLVEKSGVDETRIEVAGVGYLVPVATNLTAEGREANRRVEAVLLPRQKP